MSGTDDDRLSDIESGEHDPLNGRAGLSGSPVLQPMFAPLRLPPYISSR